MTIQKNDSQLENARRLRREMTPFKTGEKTLSVTCGDSSPKGRAKYRTPLHGILA